MGIKSLLNTSFNAQSAPMVRTLEDARKAGKRMKLDALVLNGELIELA